MPMCLQIFFGYLASYAQASVDINYRKKLTY